MVGIILAVKRILHIRGHDEYRQFAWPQRLSCQSRMFKAVGPSESATQKL